MARLGDHQGTTAASDAHQFLPQELQPPSRIDAPEQAVPGESDTSQVVADHMASLEHAVPEPPAIPEPPLPTTYDSVDSAYSSTDPAGFESLPDPGSLQAVGNPPTTPGGGDFGMSANATGPVLPGRAATTGATAATTAAAAAQGGSLLAPLLAALAIIGLITVYAYEKNNEPPIAYSVPTTDAGGTAIANDWQTDITGITGIDEPTITSTPQTGVAAGGR